MALDIPWKEHFFKNSIKAEIKRQIILFDLSWEHALKEWPKFFITLLFSAKDPKSATNTDFGVANKI